MNGEANFLELAVQWAQLIGTVALLLTLIVVTIYTKATSKMADATKQMAINQEKEIEFNNRQIVVVDCYDPNNYEFRTSIYNKGRNHAKIKIKATIKIGEKILELTENHRYNGKIVWGLQAGAIVYGHLALKQLYSHNKLNQSLWKSEDTRIRLETWVIRFDEDESKLDDNSNKNPVMYYNWSIEHQVWIPEVSPDYDL